MYSSNKSFSNEDTKVIQITSSGSICDAGNTILQHNLCYHQCTKCAVVFQCQDIELEALASTNVQNLSFMANVILATLGSLGVN